MRLTGEIDEICFPQSVYQLPLPGTNADASVLATDIPGNSDARVRSFLLDELAASKAKWYSCTSTTGGCGYL